MKPLSLLFLMGFFVAGCTGVRPSTLGVRDGRLAPCPSTPNCVSSRDSDKGHAIEPLKFSGPAKDAMAKLKAIIQDMPRAVIVTGTENYLHAAFTSLIFRFVDDVEFYFDDAAKLVQIRSASRLGRSDFGVNRKRTEVIRAAWEADK
jgi:uncharacterized protein (DUF1499 family)